MTYTPPNRSVHKEPVVTRTEIVWVPESRCAVLTAYNGKRPFRVWSLFWATDPSCKPEAPDVLVHAQNAFLEDYVHDWTMGGPLSGTTEMTLRYYSRVATSCVWILVQYTD